MASTARIDELRKKFDENPRRYFAPLANEHRKAGDLDEAIALCRTHLPQQPGHISGHVVLAQALYEARQHDESRQVFEQALDLDPENLIALRYLGDIARERGDLGGARGWYQRVLETDPRNEDIQRLLVSLDETPVMPHSAYGAASAGTPVSSPAIAEPPVIDAHSPMASEVMDSPTASLAMDSPMANVFDEPAPAVAAPSAPVMEEMPSIPIAESFTAPFAAPYVPPPLDEELHDADLDVESFGALPAAEAPPVEDHYLDRDEPALGIDLDAIDAEAPADGGLDLSATPQVERIAASFEELDLGSFESTHTPEPSPAYGDLEAAAEPSLDWSNDGLDGIAAGATGLGISGPEGPTAYAPEPDVASVEQPAIESASYSSTEETLEVPAYEPREISSQDDAWDWGTPTVALPETSEPAPAPEPEPVSFDAPSYEEPAYEEPAYEEPAYEEPVVSAEMASAEMAPEPVGYEPADVPPADEAPAAPAQPNPFVTETMAELYLQQGFRTEALSVYRQLLEMNPHDPVLRDRVAQLESSEPAESYASALHTEPYDAERPSPRPTARSFFARLASRTPSRPRAAQAEMAYEAQPTPDRNAAGRPARAADNELSLDTIFGASGGAPARANTSYSFDQFFSDSAERGGTESAAVAPSGAAADAASSGNDIEQFTAWLEGLKKK